MKSIERDERRARLGVRHHLAAPSSSPVEVAGNLVGLHSSDPVTVYLSLRARVKDISIGDVEDALYEARTLVRILGMRRTMFVVPRDLAALIDTACTRALAPAERRRLAGMLERQGIADDGAAWLARVERTTLEVLRRRGEATARQLREDVPDLKLTLRYGDGTKWGGEFGISTRVLFLLATKGEIIRARPLGSWISSQYRWATVDAWLGGEFEHMSKAAAEDELLTRFLRTYGPATLLDVAWWTGWGKRQTRAALSRIGAEEVGIGDETGYVTHDDEPPASSPASWVALLPSLDSTVMGWKQRDWYLGPHAGELFDRNGNAGPTIWWDGRVVGGWAHCTDGSVATRLLEDVPGDADDMIRAEAERLEKWFEDKQTTPRFRTPLEQALRNETG